MCWWMGATPPVIYSTLQLRTVVRLHCCFRYLCELTPTPPSPQTFSVFHGFSKFKLPAPSVSQVFASQRLKAAGHDNQYGATDSFFGKSTRFKGVKGSLTLMKNSGRGGATSRSKTCCLRTIESFSWDLSRALRFIFDLLCERYSVQTIFNQNIFRFDLNLISPDL